MTKRSLAALFLTCLFAACGEESTTEKIVEVAAEQTVIVADVSELPKCEKDNEGAHAYVKGETSERICVDGKWFALKDSEGSADVDFSCSTQELKDGSGLKIVCNGDSIGVVLNGAKGDKGTDGVDGKDGVGKDGEDGKDGVGCSIGRQTDSTVTITCGEKSMTLSLGAGGVAGVDTTTLDSEKVAVSLDSLAGFSQKGPFLKGSTVFLYELQDGRSLKQTNGNFTSEIKSDDGHYKFNARNLVSQYALLMVDGKYRNEVTGKNTTTAIKLQAYTDVTERKTANVNLLTHLEKERVYNLVTKKKMKVWAAKRQAQAEILAAFHIDTTGLKGFSSAEDLDVFGKTDADAALLAISILLQGDGDETALSVLLTDISNDLAEDGVWNGESAAQAKAAIADWVLSVDGYNGSAELATYRANVKNWGLSTTVPEFEKFVRRFAGLESGLGVCGSESIPVGTVKNVENAGCTNFYAPTYTSQGNRIRFICADADSAKWREAKDIEKDTMEWGHDFNEGDVRNGRVNSDLTYVYQDGNWRLGTNLDNLLVRAGGEACLTVGDTSTVKYNNVYYVCTANTGGAVRGWKKAPDIYNDTYESRKECSNTGTYGDGTILAGRVNTNKKYVCDDGEFRMANSTEISYGKGCTSHNSGELYIPHKQYSYYKCGAKGWEYDFDNLNKGTVEYGGKTYRTIGIKTQNWMAENLAFEYKVDGASYGNYCNTDNCETYGRYYTWAAAMDSAGVNSTNGKGCGYGKTCSPSYPVRGICPEGWHLPSSSEWNTLYSAMGSSPYAMQAKEYADWSSATDVYGFSALPAGVYSSNGNFGYVGSRAHFWSATENGSDYAYYWYLDASSASLYSNGKYLGFAVRCLQDSP